MPLAIPRRQARALLFCLASSRQAITRQALQFLFWPDIPERDARRHLTRILTHLRRALPVPKAIETADDRIGLDPVRSWSDAAEFDRLCAVRDARRRIVAMRQAVELYAGPFLAGFSLPGSPEFEAWCLREQCTQERVYLEALEALIEDRVTRGAYREAISYARRYLETDELAEKIHIRLIKLYTLDNDRGAALRQFERCAAILEREFGVSPLPETRMAYLAALQSPDTQSALPTVAASPT